MPSRRRVLTCRPNLPGGRFAGPLFNCRPSKDSKGSRRACFTSLSAAAGAEPGVAGFSTAWTALFAAGFLAVALAACFPVGLPAALSACGAGLPTSPSADFTLLGVDGFTCARRPGVAAAIKIPSPRVIAERIVRSFPLRVSQPRQLEVWLRLPEPHPYRRAW